MIRQIKFVSIPVRDQNRALDFYTGKLGFTILADKPFDQKQRWIELRIPKADTHVVLFTPDEHQNRIGTFSGISFQCDDVEATYADYVAKGVKFRSPPQKQPWGTFVIFEDSEGNSFVLGTAK
ncbi:MAG: VOC family protein [Verrucomicrobia bacterium]|nr:VOC family protein [Verrucomicrobiota bacterium]